MEFQYSAKGTINSNGGIAINISNNNTDKTKEKAEQLENANSELRAFNYIISHEVKAPVRAIDGYARIFIEDYEKEISKEGIELIKNIRHICSDTLVLVNKLLEYIKLADKEPAKEVINLEQLIQDTFKDLLIGYTNKEKVQLKFKNKLPNILGDKILMKQVICNTISNALKFTGNKKLAIISIGYSFECNEHKFYIKDNGAGFNMEFSENIFEMFTRMHSESEFEGSGIGLAIVKKIIQKFGGRVWITGKVGKGACIYFTISEENILK
ncbi:sensor histidine kinase [Clostridium saccharoperbutylacetonicum]|uniref:sensor histidine kinase n=1 Tax=Clostridium saccharoperbutylacetonicum TaxID=36745 RepID=UPI0039EADC94